MKNFIVLAAGLISFNAFGAGFQTGNTFEAVVLRGPITISCDDSTTGQRDYVSEICEYEVLDPAEFVKFSGEQGTDADEVSLTSKWENGSTRTKTEDFDSEKGISKGHFNLWIATLFQRPLLNYGKNEVTYEMKKDGETVKTGNFVALVNRGQDRTCNVRHYFYSRSMNDCRFPQNLCRQYFSMYNYCQ